MIAWAYWIGATLVCFGLGVWASRPSGRLPSRVERDLLRTLAREPSSEPPPRWGETLRIRTEYEPWLWGFARWEVKDFTGVSRGVVVETVARGRWLWVGRGAACSDRIVERGSRWRF
jgi:hypothetical protein